ncbi:MAG: urease subunit gamma [Nitrosopumilaceae archaeon]
MIHLKIEVKGEPDVPPFTRIFEHGDKTDEQIFFNSVDIVKEKLTRNFKINTNEALLVYCAYIVNELRSGKSKDTVEKNASKILSTHNVMIGVPETLRKITFEATIDGLPKEVIIFEKPIPISDYILTTEQH